MGLGLNLENDFDLKHDLWRWPGKSLFEHELASSGGAKSESIV